MVKFITLQSNGLEDILNQNPDSVVWNLDKTELTEIYYIAATDNIPTIRRMYSYSKKMNHVKESFSKKIGKAKGMKLFRIEGTIAQYFSKKDNMIFPPAKVVSEMKEIAVISDKNGTRYFQRYKNLIQKK
jgi:hypothetical protein